MATSDNHKKRFLASGWNYILVSDGNDLTLLNKAIKKRKSLKPTLIEIKTLIGYGSPLKILKHMVLQLVLRQEKKQQKLNYPYKPLK